MTVRIELMTPADWLDVRAIYEEGIATGLGTFETVAPSWEEWNAARLPHSRLVAREQSTVGWAALSPVSRRACYAGVAKVGIYVAASAHADTALDKICWKRSSSLPRRMEYGPCKAATIAENAASLALQARCGFRVVGRRERIGKLAGIWRDTVLTERGSKKLG
jgi:L-amino acid N-acyltransferase YncA